MLQTSEQAVAGSVALNEPAGAGVVSEIKQQGGKSKNIRHKTKERVHVSVSDAAPEDLANESIPGDTSKTMLSEASIAAAQPSTVDTEKLISRLLKRQQTH